MFFHIFSILFHAIWDSTKIAQKYYQTILHGIPNADNRLNRQWYPMVDMESIHRYTRSPHLFVPGLKNRINGTQRTEQSEVYGTKKEEKREKRRKLVQYFVPKCSYYLCPGTYLKWCQNPNFNTYTGYFSIQFFDCYFMVQIVKYSDFP